MLLAIGMDANRNYDHYVDGNSRRWMRPSAIPNGGSAGRRSAKEGDFRPFLAAEFSRSMESLRYLKKPLDRMKLVRSDREELATLLSGVIFKEYQTAYKFWDDVLKYSTDQTILWEKTMSLLSKIEWTDATWNPVRGCTKISPGLQALLRGDGLPSGFAASRGIPSSKGSTCGLFLKSWRATCVGEPRMIFVNSMSDCFQEGVPFPLYRAGRRNNAAGALAHLPGAYETFRDVCGNCLRASRDAARRRISGGAFPWRTGSTACRG